MPQWNKRSFFYNAGVMTLSGLCLQGIGFIYRIYLSRAAGAEGLGLYRLILPVHSLSIAICIAGVRMAATALSAELRAASDRLAVRMLTRLCLTIYLAVFLLAAAVVIWFRDPIASSMLGDIRTSPALPVMMFCIFLTGFELILESIFLGIGETRYTAVSNLLEQLTQMAAVICLLTQLHPTDSGETALWIVTGMVISEIPVVIWLLISYRRVVCRGCRAPKAVPRGLLSRIGKIALPVTLGGAVTTLLSSAGTVLLPRRLVAAGLSESQALEELGIIS
ncbi:MAG: oligosaccharide flippase family protein, partial [Clostridia bacterium]|nr:oligosaccharide flippase family protein [Clostridia bacterium]